MGKSAPAAAAPAYVPPPPPTTPARPYGEQGQQTPTGVLKEKEEPEQAVVKAPPEPIRPKSTYLDNEDAGRKKERDLANQKGRVKTRKTVGGAQGLLSDANTKKKGLMAP